MEQKEEQRFQLLYQRHLQLLKLQGKSKKTIDAHSRAVRWTWGHGVLWAWGQTKIQQTTEEVDVYSGADRIKLSGLSPLEGL